MSKAKSRKKQSPKRVLANPDLEQAKTAVLNSPTSVSGQRTYDQAIREFVASEFTWNSGDTHRPRSPFGSLPFRVTSFDSVTFQSTRACR
jgi:hypothetical protein